MNKVNIYANGLIHCSACADSSLTPEQVAQEVNLNNMSGVGPWVISKDNFADGSPNPKECEKDKSRKHYLFNC